MDAEKQVINYPNGDVYVGSMDEKGLPHGFGVMKYKEEPYYEWMKEEVSFKEYRGEWQHGVRSGSGVMKFHAKTKESVKYSGEWIDNKPDGQGKITLTSKDCQEGYEGGWKAGLRHGWGKYHKLIDSKYYPSEEYEGEWVNDLRCGKGSLKYTRKPRKVEVYSGEWKNNKLNGHCVWTSADGNTIECEWIDNRKQGLGTFTFADGLTLSARWENDEMLPNGISVIDSPDTLVLHITVGHSGLDYNRIATVLLIAKEGEYKMDDVSIIKGTKEWRRNQQFITITDIKDDCVKFIIPSDFVEGDSPYYGRIARGEKVELGFSRECVATIYDEDYDYTIAGTFVMECN